MSENYLNKNLSREAQYERIFLPSSVQQSCEYLGIETIGNLVGWPNNYTIRTIFNGTTIGGFDVSNLEVNPDSYLINSLQEIKQYFNSDKDKRGKKFKKISDVVNFYSALYDRIKEIKSSDLLEELADIGSKVLQYGIPGALSMRRIKVSNSDHDIIAEKNRCLRNLASSIKRDEGIIKNWQQHYKSKFELLVQLIYGDVPQEELDDLRDFVTPINVLYTQKHYHSLRFAENFFSKYCPFDFKGNLVQIAFSSSNTMTPLEALKDLGDNEEKSFLSVLETIAEEKGLKYIASMEAPEDIKTSSITAPTERVLSQEEIDELFAANQQPENVSPFPGPNSSLRDTKKSELEEELNNLLMEIGALSTAEAIMNEKTLAQLEEAIRLKKELNKLSNSHSTNGLQHK